MSKKVKLYGVTVTCSANCWKYNQKELDAKVTTKSYITDGHRISFDRIMKAETNLNISHRLIGYKTFCLSDDIDKAIDILKAKIMEDAIRIRDEWKAVETHLFTK